MPAPVLLLMGASAAVYGLFYYFASSIPPDFDPSKLLLSSYRYDKVFDTCILKELTPWDADTRKVSNVSYDPLVNCNRNFVPFTYLDEDRIVRLHAVHQNDETLDCRTRTLDNVNDFKFFPSEWVPLRMHTVNDADFVEVICERNGNAVYQWIHQQIVPQNATIPDTATATEAAEVNNGTFPKPNVYVILFDSVASTQGERTFPRAISYLRREFGAVTFRHVNKVGENSRPNGIPLFFGKFVLPVDRDMFGMPSIEADWNYTKFCSSYLDNDSFVPSDFGKAGYKTLMAEDWARGFINWPGCLGFSRQPTTHYNRAFYLRYEGDKGARSNMTMDNCREHHLQLLDYMERFINAYKDDPKFSLLWASILAHDSFNMPFHADTHLEEFFSRNREELDNSFLFLMADHGMRWGATRWAPMGGVEANNPMLHISVPRWLRNKGEMLRNLRRNSVELVTHFDTHATFIDIYKMLPKSNFTSYETLKDEEKPEEEKRGNSLFRPLPPWPRNCKTLPIPPQYCLCDIQKVPATDKTLKEAIGHMVAVNINKIMKDEGIEAVCQPLHFDEMVSLSMVKDSDALFEGVARLQPGGGEFRAYARNVGSELTPKFVSIIHEYDRLNEYGRAGDCITLNYLRPYCYCRNYTTTTAAPSVKPLLTTQKITSPSPSSLATSLSHGISYPSTTLGKSSTIGLLSALLSSSRSLSSTAAEVTSSSTTLGRSSTLSLLNTLSSLPTTVRV